MRRPALMGAALVGLVLSSPLVHAQSGAGLGTPNRNAFAYETDHGAVIATDANGVYAFNNWAEYHSSRFFLENDMRCGAQLSNPFADGILAASAADCSNTNTNPDPSYDPGGGATYTVDVVFHVLQHKNGSGAVSDAAINSQMQILNEDFNAISGSLGANGFNAKIQFNLAGVTRTQSVKAYNDSGSYWNGLAWDTTKYLNIYTNTAGGNLGYAYVPSGGGVVGNSWDRVVMLWSTIGLNAPYGAPYNLGRTLTHEVGHYLGLYHTFDGGCASASGCNQNGDLICDTNPESSPNYSSCSRTTCGSPDPTNNYMDYSNDICMTEFTVEQVRRMRCTLETFRSGLTTGGPGGNPPAKATNPNPSNGASSVSTSAGIAWGSASGATSYDVYFGTDATPDAGELQGNQSGTSFNPGALANGTTYYWRVDSKNADGTTTGDVWSFTTATGGTGGFTLSVNGYKSKGKWQADLTWSGASGGSVEIYRSVNGGTSQLIATVANSGSYTNQTSFKGGGSLTFTVCEIGGAVCSNSATANY